MKKSLFLFITILVLLTGCNEKESASTKNTTGATTTKMIATGTQENNNEENESDEHLTTINTNTIEKPMTTTKNGEKTTTRTSGAYTPTTSEAKKTSSTITTKATTKKTTTTTTKKTTTKATTKKTTTTTKVTTTVKSTLTEKEVYNKMIALKSKYPNGTPWGNDKCYVWNGNKNKDIKERGCGCAGFAFTLSDAAFGTKAATKHTDVSKIRVGDILRLYNDTHSVIVLEVTSTGVTVAEGNMTIVGVFENAVYWGRKISNDELKSSVDYILTRW